MTKLNYEKKLDLLLTGDEKFQIALNLVRRISTGKVWLIGSGVYKNLLKIKHGTNLSLDDYDFVVEEIKKPLPKLKGWEISENTFGNLRFKKDGITVDPVPLKNMLLLKEWGWKPNIRNFMRQVGFSVQAIAFDVNKKKIIGGKAIKDISKKVIRINNKRNYNWAVARYGDKVSLSVMAKKLGLKPVN
ncbi:MAG: hypothetical protein HYT62_00885 [Candidatus Yanofskybacteria bacterium]|nr:hypothetical protein [Candidatus Yanofskybacteria bacterium]